MVQEGIPSMFKHQVSALYAEAFERKFVKVIADKHTMSRLFLENMDEGCGLCFIEDNKVMGVAGFHRGSNALLGFEMKTFTDEFGYIKGFFKCLMILLFYNRKPSHEKELLMDGIVVDKDHRGRGIGTKLFGALEEYAKRCGYTQIKLDVIKENPKAKALYTRLGFKPTKEEKVPKFIAGLIGVSAVTTMVKNLD